MKIIKNMRILNCKCSQIVPFAEGGLYNDETQHNILEVNANR